jgi:thioredoxin 1
MALDNNNNIEKENLKLEISEINNNNFEEEVLKSDIPVIVDFFTHWCNPCKALVSTFESLAETFKEKVKFVKMDCDENSETSGKYNVGGIPCLILFDKEEENSRKAGLLSKEQYEEWINEFLESKKPKQES